MTDLPAIVGFVGYAALCALVLLALFRCYRRSPVKAPKVPVNHFSTSDQVVTTQEGIFRVVNGEWVPFQHGNTGRGE